MPRRQILAASLAAAGLATAAIAPSADATTVVFQATGAERTFVVPTDVTSLHVVAVGGHGGTGTRRTAAGTAGGSAAQLTADLAVTPGQVLFVEVGGRGGDATFDRGGAGGFNGGAGGGNVESNDVSAGGAGGGGGGASDVRTADRSTATTLATRLVVAAGGGGGGGGLSGGRGGAAGSPARGDGMPGAGASAGAGGAGATATGPTGSDYFAGKLGVGGFPSNTGFDVSAGAGGGGGAGLFGGSGGLNGSAAGASGGGGGAGSSGSSAAATGTTIVPSDADPSVTLSFGDAAPAPAPAAATPAATGSGTTAATTASTTAAPAGPVVLGSLSASPSRFRAATSGGTLASSRSTRTGTELSWNVDRPAVTAFTVLQARPGRRSAGRCVAPRPRVAVRSKDRCTRTVELGGFEHRDTEGRNAVRFSGRVHGRRLAAGAYRLRATPSAGGVAGTARTLALRVR